MKKILVLILFLTTNQMFSQFCETFNQYSTQSYTNQNYQIEYNVLDNWGSICSTLGYSEIGSINGQGDLYLNLIDEPCGNGASWVFNSTDFSGNWLTGLQFSYDFILFDGGQFTFTTESIYIYNGADPTSSSLVAKFVLNNPITINDGWTTITPHIALVNQGSLPNNNVGYWEMVTGSDWDNLIQNVGGLGYKLDLNTSEESFGLDNICLQECELPEEQLILDSPICYYDLPYTTPDYFLNYIYHCDINGVTVMDFTTGYLDPQYFNNGNFIIDSPGEYVIGLYYENCYVEYETVIFEEISINLPSTYVACNGNFEEICAPSGPNYTYEWHGPDHDPTQIILLNQTQCYTPSQTGNFTLIVFDGNGCPNYHTITIFEEIPQPILGEDQICIGETISIDGQGFDNPDYTILWYHNGDLVQTGGTTLQSSFTNGTITVQVSYGDCEPVSTSVELIKCCPEDIELSVNCEDQTIVLENLPANWPVAGMEWTFNGSAISPQPLLTSTIDASLGEGTYGVTILYLLDNGKYCNIKVAVEYIEADCCDEVGPIPNAHFVNIEGYQTFNTIPYDEVEIPILCDFILDASNSICEDEYIINISELEPETWTTTEIYPWTLFSGQAGIIDLGNFASFQPGHTYLLAFHAGPNGNNIYLPFTYGLDAELSIANEDVNYKPLLDTKYGNFEVPIIECQSLELDGSASSCEEGYKIKIESFDPLPDWMVSSTPGIIYNQTFTGQASNLITVPHSFFQAANYTGYYLVTLSVGPTWTEADYELIWYQCENFNGNSDAASRFSKKNTSLETQISIYPNPTNDILNLKSNFDSGVYQIFDLQGKLINQDTLTSKETTIDLSRLNSGIYFFRIQSEEGELYFEKVVKN